MSAYFISWKKTRKRNSKTLQTNRFSGALFGSIVCRYLNDGGYEELFLTEVRTIFSISDRDLQQLVNYTFPTIAKQGEVFSDS